MHVCTPGLGEDGRDRFGEPGQPVDAGDQDVAGAAAVQVIKDRQPELRALAVAPPDPERFAVAVAGHADGEIARAVAHRAVLADLHRQRVEVHDRLDGVKRP